MAKRALCFCLDSAQRIYARGYKWTEVGLNIRPEQVHRLSRNYRNTRQIAALAASILIGIPEDEDATKPDFSSATRNGSNPILLRGRYSSQVAFALNFIRRNINLADASVVFLHPKEVVGSTLYVTHWLSKN